MLVIWRYWQPCEETSECSGDLECVRRPGGRWDGLKVIMVSAKKKVTEGDGDLKVIMLLAKKVMEGDWDSKCISKKSYGRCGR